MNDIQEGARDQFAKYALSKGFELLRSSGKHNIWKHPSGAQITSPKTTSDWRSIKNFQAELKSRLQSSGVNIKKPEVKKPVELPVKKSQQPITPTVQQRYQSGQQLKTGTQTTFKDFMAKVTQAKEKAVPTKKQELLQRMNKGVSDTIRSWPLDVKRNLADRVIRQIRNEQMTAPKLMNTNMLDLRTTKEKQKEIKVMADLLPFNPDIGKPYKTQ